MNAIGGVIILGTDTEVGKTYQACSLLRALTERGVRAGAYKPVASGVCDGAGDAALLRAAAQLDCPLERICPQQFAAAVAPPIAARLEGRSVNQRLLFEGARWWRQECEFLVVEGVGGALSPISSTQTCLDLAQELQLPVLLVAANRLGVVNHTLLTLEAIASRGLACVAIVLNSVPTTPRAGADEADDVSRQSNAGLISAFTSTRVVSAAVEVLDELLSQAEGTVRSNPPSAT